MVPHHSRESDGRWPLAVCDDLDMPKPERDKVVAVNRRARHDYTLEGAWEAGIVLQGTEVKSLRVGRASLVDGFVDVDGGEAWLHGVHIPAYHQGTWTNHASRRKRKLLLHRSEIDKLERRANESGLTIIPLRLYFSGGRAKVEIALGRGRRTWDKRQALAERQAAREAEQAVARRLKGITG
jgi:SsrA-binding protein